MAQMEEPTARARWMVARKGRFYLVAALLFVAGVAAAAWAALSGNGVGALIFAIVLVPSVFLVLLPLVTESYINGFDGGRERAAMRRASRLSLISSLAMVVASVVSLVGSDRYRPIWWIVLVVSGLLAIIAIVQLLRRAEPGKQPPQA